MREDGVIDLGDVRQRRRDPEQAERDEWRAWLEDEYSEVFELLVNAGAYEKAHPDLTISE